MRRRRNSDADGTLEIQLTTTASVAPATAGYDTFGASATFTMGWSTGCHEQPHGSNVSFHFRN